MSVTGSADLNSAIKYWGSSMKRVFVILTTAALTCGLPSLARGQTAPERFQGSVVDVGGAVPNRTSAHFTLHVDEYSTFEEVEELLQVLLEGGSKALDKALFDTEAKGWIRIGNSLGYHLAVVRSLDTENGRVIRAVTDRPIQMFEVMRGLRSADHTLGFLEFTLDEKGKGSGQLVAAAKINIDKEGALSLESLGTRAFRLMRVSKMKIKDKKK